MNGTSNKRDRDERVVLRLEPEVALRGLLQVELPDDDDADDRRDEDEEVS